MFSLQKTLDSSWDIARQSLREDLITIETVINRRWAKTFAGLNVLPVPAGGTGLSSFTAGDLVYASATTTLAGLGIGTSGTLLRSTGTLPAWSGFTIPNAFAQGDLVYASVANGLTALAKNATATRYLSNTGASNSPAWAQVDVSNGVTGMAALTKVDDTNVTMTLGGTPASALIRAVSLTLGWTGTLSAARGGTGVGTLGDITRISDTNVTLTLGGTPVGSVITSVSFTLSWSGTLAVSRGGIGVGTLAAHGVLLGQGTSAVTATAVGATNTVLHGNTGADPTFSTVVEADITLANNTTNNVTTAKHGFTPILPNDATKYLDGTGAYTVPAGSGGTTAYALGTTTITTGHFSVMSNHVILTGTQRLTVQGTGRLRVTT